MRFFTVVLMVFYFISANSQKEIVLRLSHALNDSSFKYNQIFEVDGNKNYYTRLQYYAITIAGNLRGGCHHP